MFSRDLGLDLGTSGTVIFQKGRGIVLREPSIVAVTGATGAPQAFGAQALQMLGRAPAAVEIVRPVRDGVIADYAATEAMLRHFFARVGGRVLARPRVAVSVPCDATSVERQAVVDVCRAAGAREALPLEEPLAAALGLGLSVGDASGQMLIEIGGGTTDIAVMALGGIVVSGTVRVGGDKIDEAIHRTLRRAHNVLLGERSAEETKIAIGSAWPLTPELGFEVRGRDLGDGMPTAVTVQSADVRAAIDEPLAQIVAGVRAVLEQTPPELANDIAHNGIWLAGGGARLRGLDKLLAQQTRLDVHVSDDPLSCVANGLGRALENFDALTQTHYSFSGEK